MSPPTLPPLPHAARWLGEPLSALSGIARAGFLDPALVAAEAVSYLQWGATTATAYAASARRHPNRIAVIDDHLSLTYAELTGRTTAMANGLRSAGVTNRDVVGLLCPNNAGFVQAQLAATKVGADIVLLNTGFAGPQLADVCEREGVTILLHDPSFDPLIDEARQHGGALRAFSTEELSALAEAYPHRRAPRPGRESRVVLLTSGTTGTPKGAHRDRAPRDPRGIAAVLGSIPYRGDDVMAIPAPLFHAWGFAQLTLAGARAATVVLAERFDPEGLLAQVERYRVTFLAVVPLMLQRILALDPDVIDRYEHSSLAVVASSGSALPGRLASHWMATFGDNLHNLYGSTEIGHVSVAGPADLHAAPGTAGRPLAGVTVRVLDDEGAPCPVGKVGRIYVATPFRFDGYTGGGSKPTIGRLMAIGDMGYFDRRGRLYIGGRDDDMIVSGGENVFPREVEDLLFDHPDIVDAAVVGVPDDEFGQRLAAFVVRRNGARLDGDDVRQLVRDRLARHKVPRDVTFVPSLPRNATGKLLRQRLAG